MFRLFRGLVNLLRLPFLPLWWLARLLSRPRGDWVVVRLHPRLTELERPRHWLLRWLPGVMRVLPTPLEALRRMRRHVARDTRIRGVVFEIPALQSGWSTCKGVRDVMAGLRSDGKEVVAFLTRGGGNHELYVATGADRVFMTPEATLMPLGLAIESQYYKPLLDRLGVEVESFARSEFKTAAEAAVRESMSDPQREQLEAVLTAIDAELVGALAGRPGMDETRARELFTHGFLRGQAAVDAGVADAICYEDELPVRLGSSEQPAHLVRAPRYLAHKTARFFWRVMPAPYIAVVQIRGVLAEQAPGGGSQGADMDHVVAALRTARADRRALGVVLQISSPGGSALASDLVHREVERLRERKPVVAYFDGVAASGGYYVAAPAHAIVAQPVSLTGSIGVLSAKVVARQALERLGVRTETLRTAPHADMFGVHRDLEQDERDILDRQLDAFYQTFVEIVARGRGRTPEEVDRIARGRVWAGADAARNGLVDRLGGFEVAIEELQSRIPASDSIIRRLKVHPLSPRHLELPPPEPPQQSSALAALEELAPDAAELLRVAGGPDRVLYYAPALPRVE